jgi:aryl-alcohol dehydrogenase-like predicted oxidoreductase
VIAAALEAYPFETVLVPLSSTDALVNDFGPVIFPLAAQRGFGVVAMKVLAAGRMTDHAAESIRYSMTLPVSTAIVGMGSVEEVRENIATATAFSPMSEKQMEDLRTKTQPAANTSVMWWKRT